MKMSKVLHREIRRQAEAEVRGKAASVAKGLADADRRVASAEAALKKAKKSRKKLRKALAKFEQSGDVNDLAEFGHGCNVDPDIPF